MTESEEIADTMNSIRDDSCLFFRGDQALCGWHSFGSWAVTLKLIGNFQSPRLHSCGYEPLSEAWRALCR
ncbi:MAG: hypothetical protein QOE96_3041 [Blastocatellia bacterium]|jgi:hypothetical protein|nr:hypothetical protein [Blastocatellia bacterium]